MSYYFVDRIISLEKDKRIQTRKGLSVTEDYLQEHFAQYPVMPGVMMLESLLQASRWLIWASQDFRPTIVVLDEVKQLKFGKFIRPGRMLEIEVNLTKKEDDIISFSGQGKVEGENAISCRFSVRSMERSSFPECSGKDSSIWQDEYKKEYEQLVGGAKS